MKKRTIITTEKREVWIISQQDWQTSMPEQETSSDQSSDAPQELALPEQKPTTTSEQ